MIKNPCTTRILVIDDDENVRTFFGHVGEMEGWDIVLTENCCDAWHDLQTRRFDLVFLDLLFPRNHGIWLLARVRRMGSRLPVVIMTGDPKPDSIICALDLGVSDFLVKPFSLDTIREIVQDATHPERTRKLPIRLREMICQDINKGNIIDMEAGVRMANLFLKITRG